MTSTQHLDQFNPAGVLGWIRRQLGQASPLGSERIPDRRVHQIRWLAHIWAALMVALFWALLLRVGAPFVEEAGSWQAPVQVGLLAIVSAGSLLAWRWKIIGATVMLFGAAGLGILAALSFSPGVAFLPFAALLVPSVLYWLAWQRTQPAYAIVVFALLLSTVMISGAYGANRVYQTYYGPTHPASTTIQPPAGAVEWVWVGGTTAYSTVVKARLTSGAEAVRLVVSDDADLSDPRRIAPVSTGEVLTFEVDGLGANRPYYYAIEANGRLDQARQGRFQTFPEGAAAFSFAFASCARTGSDGAVFDAIRHANPLFFLAGGDLYYEDIRANDPEAFRDAYQAVLNSPAQATLYRSTALAYVWDDHDYGPDDSDRTSPAREAAFEVYDEYVPHFELPAGDDGAIYQAFTVGRVRFIVTDLRSARDPASMDDGPGKSMMGTEQKAWFKQQLLDAKDRYPVIVWVSTVPWIAEASDGEDHWGGFATERREIADFIAEHDIDGLLMLAGDAHMLALDDGSNSDYSEEGDAEFPVFHAAALDRYGSAKGGPFSEGAYPGGGQFGLVHIEDDGGDEIVVELSGRDWTGRQIVGYRYAVQVPSE